MPWHIGKSRLYAAIRDATLDMRNESMGGLTVMTVTEWRPLQLLDSNEQGYTAQHALLIQSYAADHFA